jgi:acyl-CoA thioester hydrolase
VSAPSRAAVLPLASLTCVARVRVLYADTDKMGIVYHASYLRYLELARVELLRGAGLPYTRMEAAGLALPLTDLTVSYRFPARYDDLMAIHVGLSRATRVRVAFDYRITIEEKGGEGAHDEPHAPVEVLAAQTQHCCVRREDARPERMPVDVWERLAAQVASAPAT